MRRRYDPDRDYYHEKVDEQLEREAYEQAEQDKTERNTK